MLRKARRGMSSLLILCLVFTMSLSFSPTSYAAESDDLTLTFALDKNSIKPGEEAELKVSLANYEKNAPADDITVFTVEVYIDTDKLEMVKGSAKTQLTTNTSKSVPDTPTATALFDPDGTKVTIAYVYDNNLGKLERTVKDLFSFKVKAKTDLTQSEEAHFDVVFKESYGFNELTGTDRNYTIPVTAPTLSISASTTIRRGDANLDGTIDIGDLFVVMYHLTDGSKLTGDGLTAADVNKDGTVNIEDLFAIMYHLTDGPKIVD